MPLHDIPGEAKACPVGSSTIVNATTRVEFCTVCIPTHVNLNEQANTNVPQRFPYLTATTDDACEIWMLASLMLPKVTGYQLIHIEGHIEGHIDMASQHQITFKLTRETTEALIDYHKDFYLKTAPGFVYSWPWKAAQLEDLRSRFKHAVQSYTFRTDILAKEGLEELCVGELLGEGPRCVKGEILAMFEPPGPRFTDIVDGISPRSSIDITSIEKKWLGVELTPPFLRCDSEQIS